jgi:pilus assembly protein CpaE
MNNPEKIRVLIVDDIAETRENIRKLMQFEADVEVVGAARTGREAIELSQELKPDVVLMDINMPDMDGITTTETIRRKQPYIQIVILSVQSDPNYMRRAMLAGARDFLSKPPMGDELSAAIRRAGLMAIEERKKSQAVINSASTGIISTSTNSLGNHGKVIVVYSPKGGTGTTTIATNLAIALNGEDSKVVLVDGDLQYGDVTVFLNEQGKNSILDLTPRVDELDPEVVNEVLMTHSASGIRILAAPPRPEMAEAITGDQFSKLILYFKQLYSYVVVDTSSHLTDAVLSVIDIADLVILIATQDIPSIRDSKAFLSVIDGLQIPRKRLLLIMNKYNREIRIAPEKIGESLKQEVGIVIPLDDRIVGNSVNRGIPFMLDNKSQPVGKSLSSLAEKVKDIVLKQEPPEVERVGKL